MSDDDSRKPNGSNEITKRSDWSKVDGQIEKKEEEFTDLVAPADSSALATTEQQIGGVIAKMKARSITKKAGLEALKVITSRQLEVLTTQVDAAAEVKKAEAKVMTEQFLSLLDLRYNEVIHALGLRNEAARSSTLKELSDQTAATLGEIQDRDWPDFMKKKSIDVIVERWEQFIEKLMSDIDEAR